ncbi:MAG: GNAT family protein [Clostridiaceae bacterium]|nr:GNAT family N-acetyltransferase [Eubacteriales bacterium]
MIEKTFEKKTEGAIVRLREFRASDVEDYVRWFTVDTEWCEWDAPWEKDDESPEAAREYWGKYCERHRDDAPDALRSRFEIEDACGNHIGWVSAYTIDTFLEHFDTEEKMLAIGIDIPEQGLRHKGCGTEALRLYMEYLAQKGVSTVYTQTWSGNARMIRVAEKLGFTECNRIRGVREVNGKKYDALTFRKTLSGEARP